jgi:segregation and condensation protein B
MKKNLANIIESILFVAGKEVEEKEIISKLNIKETELENAIYDLKNRYSGISGIHLLQFNGKLQLASNPDYVDDVSGVLNPIREKELTKAMLETLAIVAYKQPVTKLEIEEVRGVDSNYAIQSLLKLNMLEVVGKKDTIGKPLLFGTTDLFLKRFSLSGIEDLPDYDKLLERIKTYSDEIKNTDRNLYTSHREGVPEIPDFLKDEKVDIVE